MIRILVIHNHDDGYHLSWYTTQLAVIIGGEFSDCYLHFVVENITIRRYRLFGYFFVRYTIQKTNNRLPNITVQHARALSLLVFFLNFFFPGRMPNDWRDAKNAFRRFQNALYTNVKLNNNNNVIRCLANKFLLRRQPIFLYFSRRFFYLFFLLTVVSLNSVKWANTYIKVNTNWFFFLTRTPGENNMFNNIIIYYNDTYNRLYIATL